MMSRCTARVHRPHQRQPVTGSLPSGSGLAGFLAGEAAIAADSRVVQARMQARMHFARMLVHHRYALAHLDAETAEAVEDAAELAVLSAEQFGRVEASAGCPCASWRRFGRQAVVVAAVVGGFVLGRFMRAPALHTR